MLIMALYEGVNCALLLQHLLLSHKTRCIIRQARNTGRRDTYGGCAICVGNLGQSISLLQAGSSLRQEIQQQSIVAHNIGNMYTLCAHVCLARDSEPGGCQWQLAMSARVTVLQLVLIVDRCSNCLVKDC